MSDEQRIIDLGDEQGLVTIRVAGVEVTICPDEEKQAIADQIQSEGQQGGQPFLDIVRARLKEKTGKDVSNSVAWAYYRAVVAEAKRIDDFFSARLASPSTTPDSATPPSSAEVLPAATEAT